MYKLGNYSISIHIITLEERRSTMANTIMTSIYNHYMTTYSPKKSDARLDSHNKSELKSIYRNIVKLNKEAPLYIFDRSEPVASFALSLKEETRQLQHTILNSAGKKDNTLFKSKTAYSSNENLATVEYICDESNLTKEEVSAYELEIQTLASPQTNTGKFLPNYSMKLDPGTYSFDVNYDNMTYEFQFNISEEDTNIDIQSKLVRLFNHADIGLNASIIDGGNDTSSLQITSDKSGENTVTGEPLFTINSATPYEDRNIVDYLGIDYIATQATNAHFTINGKELSSPTNHVNINNTFDVTLQNVSGISSEPVYIGLKTNIDALKNNIYNLIGGYNTFLEAANNHTSLASSNKLNREMQNVAKLYRNELDAVGINITEQGTLSVDDHLLTQTAQSEDAYHLLSPIKDFSSSLFQKGEEISRDPLNYANKKIVAYKNPGKNFPSPYITSNYSGLLFNYYC